MQLDKTEGRRRWREGVLGRVLVVDKPTMAISEMFRRTRVTLKCVRWIEFRRVLEIHFDCMLKGDEHEGTNACVHGYERQRERERSLQTSHGATLRS